MIEFENSFKGLINIVLSRSLHKNRIYKYSGICIIILSIVFFFVKDCVTTKTYYTILKTFVNTLLPAFITFCGFTMTAYSLVVGFLNYGVFKNTLEKWYELKIKIEKKEIDLELPQYSLYQNGIALFAFAILALLFTVFFLIATKIIIELEIEIFSNQIEKFNAIIFTIILLLTNYCGLLMIYNVVNIFTFSQSLNELVYREKVQELNKNIDK